MTIKRTIALSLTVVVLIIFTAGQGSVWVWFLFSQKEHNQQLLEDEMKSIAGLLAQDALGALMAEDPQAEDSGMRTTSVNDEVLSLRVISSDGTVVSEKKFATATDSFWNPLFIPWENSLTVPVKSGADIIGRVELTYSGEKVNEYMLDLMTVPTIIEGFVILLVIIGIFLFLQRSVGIPLGVMRERITGVTTGDLTVEIPDYGENEIGIISKGLKFLVKELKANISRINKTAESLVNPIVKLTATFENVDRNIRKQFEATESIAGSIKQASDSYKDITESTERLSEFSSDNVSFLLEVKSTSDEIVSSTNRLFKASEDSYSVVAEISQTAKVVTQNSHDVLASVDETLASVEELRASVKEVERSAKESSKLAARVREMAAEDGTLVVADAIEGMENISSKVEEAVRTVERLGAHSTDVQKMLSVIREVTEQTNLLSLNAAILAEQAGEFGKGFAVVADEMRALSDRTAASTKEIAGIVNTIQDEIEAVISSIKEGMAMVNMGSELVYKVGESMGKILEASQKSSSMAETIEYATNEQAASLDLVTNQMSSISAMASKMSLIMVEQQKGSEHMLERVGEVKEIAEITKRSTEEQAAGTAMMSKNVEFASSKISSINTAAVEQQNVSESIVVSIEDIRNLGSTTLKHVDAMNAPLQRLVDEINLLKKAMSSFMVE